MKIYFRIFVALLFVLIVGHNLTLEGKLRKQEASIIHLENQLKEQRELRKIDLSAFIRLENAFIGSRIKTRP